jgi:signal transduction histidine kinase/ActR/RegA family two-component response regulator
VSAALPEVCVVTPNDTDAEVSLGFLKDAGIPARACSALGELCLRPLVDLGCAVLVEEALVHPDIDHFLDTLAAQPTWSDLPLVLIASQGAALGALVERVFPESGNVAVLERPMNPVSLISAVRVGLRARQRQLEVRDLLEQRAAALRQRDEFLAMLAHELRNPLAPMRNAVYVMKRLDINDPHFLKTRGLIERQVTHMSRLVDDLLDVSRLELGKVQLRMQEVDLNNAVAAAAESCLALTTARGHVMQVRLAAEPLHIRADPVRIEQVICNLVTNAAKFTPEGGTIIVEVSGDEESAAVTVLDSGVGIRSDMLTAVFDLFTQDKATLERAGGGLGIGLTIVKRLVELHRGTIRVSSEGLGRGAQFTVRFPREHVRYRAGPRSDDHSTAPATRRVLVVEDNADIRESLGMLLTMWGHTVDYAESGPDGVARARDLRPDVALIDIGLPGLNGYEVARHIRDHKDPWARQMKLIALTGYGRDADRDEAIAAGFDRHLVKPIDPEILAKVLQAS